MRSITKSSQMGKSTQVDVKRLLDSAKPRRPQPSTAPAAFSHSHAVRADLAALAVITMLDGAATRPPGEVLVGFRDILMARGAPISKAEPLEDIWAIARRDFSEIRAELMGELCLEISPGAVGDEERGVEHSV